ncbi:MAG: hypothetical protein ACE37F_30485 [Nannocystaceae bacterium]
MMDDDEVLAVDVMARPVSDLEAIALPVLASTQRSSQWSLSPLGEVT